LHLSSRARKRKREACFARCAQDLRLLCPHPLPIAPSHQRKVLSLIPRLPQAPCSNKAGDRWFGERRARRPRNQLSLPGSRLRGRKGFANCQECGFTAHILCLVAGNPRRPTRARARSSSSLNPSHAAARKPRSSRPPRPISSSLAGAQLAQGVARQLHCSWSLPGSMMCSCASCIGFLPVIKIQTGHALLQCGQGGPDPNGRLQIRQHAGHTGLQLACGKEQRGAAV
jgi:hypothetical protein